MFINPCRADNRYEVLTTPTDVIMVMEYAGEELFTYIVETGKGGVSPGVATPKRILITDARTGCPQTIPTNDCRYRILSQAQYCPS
jgi:hypothetical protein